MSKKLSLYYICEVTMRWNSKGTLYNYGLVDGYIKV
jgi:hypothetical protein